MARRSPQNPRYQKDRVGSTKKSAASAKPKRSAGERGEASKASKGETTGGRWFNVVTTPEIKRWRRIWWGLVTAAALAWAALLLVPVRENTILLSVAYGVFFFCLAAALYIDWGIIRKLRKAEMERLRKESKGR